MTDAAPPSAPNLRAALESAPDAAVAMRMDGTVAGWSDKAGAMFGWTFEEVQGRRLSAFLIPPDYRSDHEQGLAHFKASGEGPFLHKDNDVSAMRRDGAEIPVWLFVTFTREFGEPLFFGRLRPRDGET